LRPQRQIGRGAVVGLALLLAGSAGGLVLGLSLRPGAPVQQPQQRAEALAAAPSAPLVNGALPNVAPDLNQGGLPKAALFAAGSDATRPAPAAAPAVPAARANSPVNEVETLRKGVVAERERLTEAEAKLAQLQAQVAQREQQMAQREQASQREILARREAALASLPPVTSPLPPPSPRSPRAEPAAGVGSGVTPGGGAASQSGHQRVVLHHRAGSYAASEAAGAMASQVRDAGFDLNETRSVTATPSQRVVRYFHAEDAPAAARLAGRLGRGWALQDFRSYEPLPSPGLLEVWLPDR
jgi:TolA-binding protein